MVSRTRGRLLGAAQRGLGAALLSLLCLGLVLLAPARKALATETPVPEATLTLTMEYTSGETTALIDGVEATVYRVASLDDAVNHYELLPEFASLGVDFDLGLSAEQMEATAQDAAAIVKAQGIQGTTATSGTDGRASFGVLPYGVYVVVQTGASGTAASYDDFRPFLISVPQVTEDDVVFDVQAVPKFTPKDAPEPEPPKPEPPEPEPPTPPKPPTPKTSDLFNSKLVLALVGCGVALVVAGALLSRKK